VGGDDGSALWGSDGGAVDVSELVVGVITEAGDDPGEQHGGDGAGRRVVVAAGVAYEPLVAGGELGIDSAGPVGGLEQGGAQAGVASFGGSAGMVGEPGGAPLWGRVRRRTGRRPGW
jgi:hypothetical protein